MVLRIQIGNEKQNQHKTMFSTWSKSANFRLTSNQFKLQNDRILIVYTITYKSNCSNDIDSSYAKTLRVRLMTAKFRSSK